MLEQNQIVFTVVKGTPCLFFGANVGRKPQLFSNVTNHHASDSVDCSPVPFIMVVQKLVSRVL